MNTSVLDQDPYFFKRSQLNMSGTFELSGDKFSADEVIEALRPVLTDERVGRIDQIIENRSFQVVPVMESIYDRGNISAVMRSAEAFGYLRCHIIEAEDAVFKAANRVTKGADKWLDARVFQRPQASVEELKSQGYQVYATHLQASIPLESIDFTKPTAIVLGNEKDGVSPEMQELCDGNVIIPMQGFSQSFNISVAAALIFYHAFLMRKQNNLGGDLSEKEKHLVRANYFLRCLETPEKLLQRWRTDQSVKG